MNEVTWSDHLQASSMLARCSQPPVGAELVETLDTLAQIFLCWPPPSCDIGLLISVAADGSLPVFPCRRYITQPQRHSGKSHRCLGFFHRDLSVVRKSVQTQKLLCNKKCLMYRCSTHFIQQVMREIKKPSGSKFP